MPPPRFLTPFRCTHIHEQTSKWPPELKRVVQEHQSEHQPQILQTNMWVRRPSSSVTQSVFAFPPGMSSSSPPLSVLLGVVNSSARELSAVLMCLPSSCLSVCLSGWPTESLTLIDLAGIWGPEFHKQQVVITSQQVNTNSMLGRVGAGDEGTGWDMVGGESVVLLAFFHLPQ